MKGTPKVLRIHNNLSIIEAAKLLNIKTSELRAIESFTKSPSWKLIDKMVEVYDVVSWSDIIFQNKQDEAEDDEKWLKQEIDRLHRMMDVENSKKILIEKNNDNKKYGIL